MKNLRNAFLQAEVFILDETVVSANCLPSNEVQLETVKRLIEFQETRQLKVAPHLNCDALEITSFSKMKVGPAVHLLGRETANSIRFMVEHHGFPDSDLTTAFFLERCGQWFDLMTSRSRSHCFSPAVPEKREKAIEMLNSFIHMICSLKVNKKDKPQGKNPSNPLKRRKMNPPALKPWQKGIRLSTTSMIQLQANYIDLKGFSFLLWGRFLQDPLENVFSSMRRTQKFSSNPIRG